MDLIATGKSWKTTLSGVIVALIILLRQLSGVAGVPVPVIGEDGSPVLDDNGAVVTQAPPSFDLDAVLFAVGLLGIGVAARDGDKSSQDVGIR